MKTIEVLKLKYIPIIEIKKQNEKLKPKLTKENQDYIKEISGSGFIEILYYKKYEQIKFISKALDV